MTDDDATGPELGTPLPSERGGRSRRAVLGLAGGSLVAVAGAAGWLLRSPDAPAHHAAAHPMIDPHDPLVAATEARRHASGKVRDVTITAAPGTVDLAGRQVHTWFYGGQLARPLVRLTAGDRLRAKLVNALPAPTTVHWHGLALRNDMDGVPDVTQSAVAPGRSFQYDFVVPDPGTYWLHSHVGLQRDRGLYAPLIVDDPHEPGDYDQELTVVLDDWADGVLGSPETILAQLKSGHGSMLKHAMDPKSPWGPMLGDVAYPMHLVNGRPPADPATFTAKPGQRLRIRFINAAADSTYRVAVGGHRMSVTHTDGWPVRPVTVDSLLIGMAERYDVIVTAADGVFPIVAAAEGRDYRARAILRTGAGTAPDAAAEPAELHRRLLSYADLRPAAGSTLPKHAADRTVKLLLSQDPSGYRWLLNHRAAPQDEPITTKPGERLRIELENASTMAHPMHLHGHTFALADTGVRKDTVVVLPGKTTAIEVQADNPGQWMFHCHNAYHMAAGMSTMLSYCRA